MNKIDFLLFFSVFVLAGVFASTGKFGWLFIAITPLFGLVWRNLVHQKEEPND